MPPPGGAADPARSGASNTLSWPSRGYSWTRNIRLWHSRICAAFPWVVAPDGTTCSWLQSNGEASPGRSATARITLAGHYSTPLHAHARAAERHPRRTPAAARGGPSPPPEGGSYAVFMARAGPTMGGGGGVTLDPLGARASDMDPPCYRFRGSLLSILLLPVMENHAPCSVDKQERGALSA